MSGGQNVDVGPGPADGRVRVEWFDICQADPQSFPVAHDARARGPQVRSPSQARRTRIRGRDTTAPYERTDRAPQRRGRTRAGPGTSSTPGTGSEGARGWPLPCT